MAFTEYEDNQFKITIGEDIGEKITEALFYIKNKDEKDFCSAIPIRYINISGEIERGQLESKLNEINPEIVVNLKKANISMDSAHLVLCLAYLSELKSPSGTELPSCAFGPITG